MAQTDLKLKTLTALFDNIADARSAVADLVANNFRREDINMVAQASAEEYGQYFDKSGTYIEPLPADHAGAVHGAEAGAVLGGLAGFLIGFIVLPGVGGIIAAGPILSALVGAGAGALAGGLLGALTDQGLPNEHAAYYAEGVRRGGTLVIVKAEEVAATLASDVLSRHNPIDLQQRVASWKEAGWSTFDPAAQPYTAEQIAAERAQSVKSHDGNIVIW